jgi:purine-nucleoside phosphorylase
MTNVRIDPEEEALELLVRELELRDVGRARTAFVLGSGLGAFADRLEGPQVIPYAELEGMPKSTVPGHDGELVVGAIEGVPVVVQKGRAHLYEGHTARTVTRCVRAFGQLGIGELVLTNAAGGIEEGWEIPSLMRITDHLSLQGRTPLVRSQARIADVYDAELGARIDDAADSCGIELHRGTYAAFVGPAYETPAEIRMLRWAGASAAGMSTALEATAARAAGMKVAAISTITNPAAGISQTPLNHEEVVAAGKLAAERFCALLTAFLTASGD